MNVSYFQTLRQLLIKSFVVYKPQFKDKIINGLIWSGITILVTAYIMPHIGLKGYGAFMVATTAVSWGFFLLLIILLVLFMTLPTKEAI